MYYCVILLCHTCYVLFSTYISHMLVTWLKFLVTMRKEGWEYKLGLHNFVTLIWFSFCLGEPRYRGSFSMVFDSFEIWEKIWERSKACNIYKTLLVEIRGPLICCCRGCKSKIDWTTFTLSYSIFSCYFFDFYISLWFLYIVTCYCHLLNILYKYYKWHQS